MERAIPPQGCQEGGGGQTLPGLSLTPQGGPLHCWQGWEFWVPTGCLVHPLEEGGVSAPHLAFAGMGAGGVFSGAFAWSRAAIVYISCLVTMPLSWSFGYKGQASVWAFWVCLCLLAFGLPASLAPSLGFMRPREKLKQVTTVSPWVFCYETLHLSEPSYACFDNVQGLHCIILVI